MPCVQLQVAVIIDRNLRLVQGPTMQMELIETFLDLCETRSFNRTAERLGITQSTVSGRVRALEQSVGRRLFQRSRAGTALTTEGLRFEPHARSLRHGWMSALHAARDTSITGVTFRVGLQHDLIGVAIDDVIAELRASLPQAVFLIEADYSVQMCRDLQSGAQDIAVLYTPVQSTDLSFETLGEVSYVMVSTDADRLDDVAAESYILANYAPAFAETHKALLPGLAQVSLSIGQNAAMVDLLTSLSGTGYVMEHSARALIAQGACKRVSDAPVITQPVISGMHNRNRHRTAFRRMQSILAAHYGPQRG